MEHAESRPGSLGTGTEAAALTFLPPARTASKCLSGCDGEDLHITAAGIRLGQKSLEDNWFGKKQAANNL